jgi:hypothetical protein
MCHLNSVATSVATLLGAAYCAGETGAHYQLAFTTPGISPRIAISRSLLRPRPNLL